MTDSLVINSSNQEKMGRERKPTTAHCHSKSKLKNQIIFTRTLNFFSKKLYSCLLIFDGSAFGSSEA